MLEVLGADAVLVGARILDGLPDRLKQPLGRLAAVVRLVVPRVEARKLLKVLFQIVFGQVLEQRPDVGLQRRLLREDGSAPRGDARRAEVLVVCDVHELQTGL